MDREAGASRTASRSRSFMTSNSWAEIDLMNMIISLKTLE